MKSTKNKSTVLFVEKNKKGLTIKQKKKTKPGFAIYPTKLQNNFALKQQLDAMKVSAVPELLPMNEIEKQRCMTTSRSTAPKPEYTEIEVIKMVGKTLEKENTDKFY
jgi:hypothetical protein